MPDASHIYIDGHERGHLDPWGNLLEWLTQNDLLQAFDDDPPTIMDRYATAQRAAGSLFAQETA